MSGNKKKTDTTKSRIQAKTTSSSKSEKPATYTVFDTRRGKTFATEREANAYEREFRKKTGIFVSVEQTHRKVTHIYGLTTADD